jgi:hypothetical protein
LRKPNKQINTRLLYLQSFCGTEMRSHRLPTVLASGLTFLDAASAALLYVTSFAGDLSTLELTANCSSATLTNVTVRLDSGFHPSWITQEGSTLYVTDESFSTVNGTVTALEIGAAGELTFLNKTGTIGGPTNSVLYGEGRGLAVADM